MKVIHIQTISVASLGYAKTRKDFIFAGWHVVIASNLKAHSKDLDTECWRIEPNFTFETEREGIKYRIFSSFGVTRGKELSLGMLKALKGVLKKEKVIIHLHGTSNWMTYAILLMYPRALTVVQQHGEQSVVEGLRNAIGKGIFRLLLHLMLSTIDQIFEHLFRSANYVIAINKREEDNFSRLTSRDRILRLTVGVNFETFKPIDKITARKKVNFSAEDKNVLYLGTLVKRKGISWLLRSFPKVLKEFPESVLWIVGDGYMRTDLENMCITLGIQDKVRFYGRVQDSLLPFFYNAADVCVVPSETEPLGMVAVEALACGCPLIGTRVGGIPDVVETFGSGVLVSPRSSEELSEAICLVLSEEYRRDQIDRSKGREVFGRENTGKQILELYYKINSRAR